MKTCKTPGAVARACNPRHWEAEAGGGLELRDSGLLRAIYRSEVAPRSVSIWVPKGAPGRIERGQPALVGNEAGQSPVLISIGIASVNRRGSAAWMIQCDPVSYTEHSSTFGVKNNLVLMVNIITKEFLFYINIHGTCNPNMLNICS